MPSIVDYTIPMDRFVIVCGIIDIGETNIPDKAIISDVQAGTLSDMYKFIPNYTTGKCAVAKMSNGEVWTITRNDNWMFKTEHLSKFATKDDEKAVKHKKFMNNVQLWLDDIGAKETDGDESGGKYFTVDNLWGYQGDWLIKVWPKNCTSKTGLTMAVGVQNLRQNIATVNSTSARRSIQELETHFIRSLRYSKSNSGFVKNNDDLYIDIFGGNK